MTSLADNMDYISDNWEMLIEDIKNGTINERIQMSKTLRAKLLKGIKPNQKKAEELRVEFEKGFDTSIILRIWEKLLFISAIGTDGFQPYTDKMKKYVGKEISMNFQCYAASEALMAV